MRGVAHRKTPAGERPAEEEGAPATAPATSTSSQTTTVVWVHDGPVCMTIIDPPAPSAHNGVCHCPACHGSMPDDWDGHFY
jgi:hypothetical protein